jgi:hypothetical protein
VGLGAAAVLLAACSSPDRADFRDAATEDIENAKSESLGIEGLDATCEDPTSKEVGTIFACTASTPNGEELTFIAEIRDGNEVLVYTTNYDREAKNVIEGTVAAGLGVSSLTATCEQPTSIAVGTTFGCTADLPGGDTVTFEAQIQEAGQVTIQMTTDVLRAESIPTIEAEAARVLSQRVGQTVPADMIDCGSEPIVAHAGEPFVCALIDPTNPNVVYDAMITVDDLTNPTQFVVEIASTPRP